MKRIVRHIIFVKIIDEKGGKIKQVTRKNKAKQAYFKEETKMATKKTAKHFY